MSRISQNVLADNLQDRTRLKLQNDKTPQTIFWKGKFVEDSNKQRTSMRLIHW